jgi:ribose 5-phosphate isomerase B
MSLAIPVGSDHAGRALKDQIVQWLKDWGATVEDVGTHTDDSVDFPDFAREVAGRVSDGRAARGVLICGSGVGVAIAANKVVGVRACVCHDTYSARQGVEHDDMNVLCLGGQVVGPALAQEIVKAWFNARFDHDERFVRRVEKIAQIEKSSIGIGSQA